MAVLLVGFAGRRWFRGCQSPATGREVPPPARAPDASPCRASGRPAGRRRGRACITPWRSRTETPARGREAPDRLGRRHPAVRSCPPLPAIQGLQVRQWAAGRFPGTACTTGGPIRRPRVPRPRYGSASRTTPGPPPQRSSPPYRVPGFGSPAFLPKPDAGRSETGGGVSATLRPKIRATTRSTRTTSQQLPRFLPRDRW